MRQSHKPTGPALERAYEQMARMRAVEEAQIRLWDDGLVPGELHTGIGEEGIVAGVLLNLSDTDSLALDHRPTPALVGRGVDIEGLLLEIMGHEDGINHGQGGHMHLFAREQRAAGDGMVGSSGPTACGFALAARHLHPGSVAVAFFGEAATNEGYMMEAFNIASAWKLPVLFVCKNNSWSITTHSREVTGGKLIERARSFGLATAKVDGQRVDEVQATAGRLITRMRNGKGPAFMLASCHRPQGHFTTDILVRVVRDPRAGASELAPGLLAAVRAPGGSRGDRVAGLMTLTRRLGALAVDQARGGRDPLASARRRIGGQAAARIDLRVEAEVAPAERSARLRMADAPAAPALPAAPLMPEAARASKPAMKTGGAR
jgi:TPP-dependent pyruvate/acetoin dehydrogenase alpha subunit